MVVREPLDRELARNPVIATKTPRDHSSAGRKGLGLWPARRTALRHLEPGPTSGAVEVVLATVAEPTTAATLRHRSNSSL